MINFQIFASFNKPGPCILLRIFVFSSHISDDSEFLIVPVSAYIRLQERQSTLSANFGDDVE